MNYLGIVLSDKNGTERVNSRFSISRKFIYSLQRIGL